MDNTRKQPAQRRADSDKYALDFAVLRILWRAMRSHDPKEVLRLAMAARALYWGE